MARSILLGVMLAAALVAGPHTEAQAQVTLDVAKMTCGEFATYKVANPKWLSSRYPKGHSGRPDIKKMQDDCIQNPGVPLMQAVETIIGPRN